MNGFDTTAEWSRIARWLVLSLLVGAALAVRAEHLADPPLDFHPIRQYRSAIIARGLYSNVVAVPEPKREVATANMWQQGLLEPPIMEALATAGYVVGGAERLWLPRLLSCLFWVLGGIFLYRCARALITVEGALAATAFHLFLPFGIAASRSFQPDPLMIMLLTLTLWSIVRHHEQPSFRRLMNAALAAAVGALVKPVGLFVAVGAFLALAVLRQGVRRSLGDRQILVFLVVAALPALVYYGACAAFIRGDLGAQSAGRLTPQLLLVPSFWWGWLKNVAKTVGLVATAVALVGMVLAGKGPGRTFLAGSLGGYAAYGALFLYHLNRQDYYQLPLIPIVALGVGSFVDAVAGRLGGFRRLAIAVVSMLAVVAAVQLYRQQAADRRARVDAAATVQLAEEIGTHVGHSAATVFLAPDNGRPLTYYGEIGGARWPKDSDFVKERLLGKPVLDTAQRLARLAKDRAPEYFIVTSMSDLESQPDLEAFLTSRFPRLVDHPSYVIFDMRRGAP